MEKNKPVWTIYSDGACRGNPGYGGWGVYIERDGLCVARLFGAGSQGKNETNNRMELTAAVNGLKFLKGQVRGTVEVCTDSQYVLNGITKWLEGWKKKGWKTSTGKGVVNQELWQELDELVQGKDIKWTWVKGHSDCKGNQEADALANRGCDNARVL